MNLGGGENCDMATTYIPSRTALSSYFLLGTQKTLKPHPLHPQPSSCLSGRDSRNPQWPHRLLASCIRRPEAGLTTLLEYLTPVMITHHRILSNQLRCGPNIAQLGGWASQAERLSSALRVNTHALPRGAGVVVRPKVSHPDFPGPSMFHLTVCLFWAMSFGGVCCPGPPGPATSTGVSS